MCVTTREIANIPAINPTVLELKTVEMIYLGIVFGKAIANVYLHLNEENVFNVITFTLRAVIFAITNFSVG